MIVDMNRIEIENKLIEEKRLQNSEDFFIPFSGQNCEPEYGECLGWDMSSHRCDCENRRVCWAIDGRGKPDNELTVDDVYAEAY